jgi:prophage tail gpP-like protein
MSPSSFTFKLTVPNDPEGVIVVAAVAAHAVEYAKFDAAEGAAFVERVREVARQALHSATDHHCLVVFEAADGQLIVTIGAESASQLLPA